MAKLLTPALRYHWLTRLVVLVKLASKVHLEVQYQHTRIQNATFADDHLSFKRGEEAFGSLALALVRLALRFQVRYKK